MNKPKYTFFEWLRIIENKVKYSGFEVKFDWQTNTLHFKWIGK